MNITTAQKEPPMAKTTTTVADSDDFNLRRLVEDTLATSTDANPHIVAKEILDAIPRGCYRDALAETLPDFVRHAARSVRPAPPEHSSGDRYDSAAPLAAAPEVSPKARAFANRRIALSMDGNEWKFLTECTADDLDAAAAMRRTMATANLAVAQKFETLAETLRSQGCETVGDLPDDVIGEAFG